MNTKLKDILTLLTVDQLKKLLIWIPNAPRVGRKDELIATITNGLALEGLRALWEQLDATQRLAVAEALYSVNGLYQSAQFNAKYGQLPDFTCEEKNARYSSYNKPPSRLGLLLYWHDGGYYLPSDLVEPLRTFVPKPETVTLKTTGSIEENALTIRYCEREAFVDLIIVLRLTEQGNKLQVSDKTSLPNAATLQLLTEQLSNGDYYVNKPKKCRWQPEIGSIKGFAWPLLLQAAGLTKHHGSKLTLSPAGLKALRTPPCDVIRTLWNKWIKSTLLDEFSRIDTIKGQKSKGRVMTAIAARRTAIVGALEHCPVNTWVNADEFSRFMLAANHTFEITHDPWKLYICDSNYGSLGYSGSHNWSLLQFRYVLSFLFEYAAPLGIIDIAYTEPEGARPDYHGLWGTDDLDFISRYDGLAYFRLTALGAYCLGLSKEYTPAVIKPAVRLSVLPSLHIHVTNGVLTTEESLLLEAWAERTTEQSWQLNRQKTLGSIEKGLDANELIAFLKERDDQPLPESVESFIRTCQRNGNALKVAGSAILIQCHDATITKTIANHKEMAGLCMQAGEQQLVVRLEHEQKFRTLIKVLGFGMTV